MKDRGDSISSSQVSPTEPGFCNWPSSYRGRHRDDDHDGDHDQDGISSEG
jgi:hypothetical protein